ncbi:MAG: M17 family peptidase N-terminal domain-containing protein [Planctomycetota bacterium]
MNLTAQSASAAKKAPFLSILVLQGQKPALPAGLELPKGFLEGFEGKPRQTRETFTSSTAWPRVQLVGLGEAAKVDHEGLRRAAAVAVKGMKAAQAKEAGLWVPAEVAACADGEAHSGRDVAEGLVLGHYEYQGAKKVSKDAIELKKVTVWAESKDFAAGIKKGAALAEACNFTRELQNRAGNQLTPTALANEAKKLATRSPQITCKVFDEAAMKKMGMGLCSRSAKAATNPRS